MNTYKKQGEGGAARARLTPEERQAEARRYVPLATTATRELRSGHLQMGGPRLCEGGGQVSCGGAERGWRPEGTPLRGRGKQVPHTARKGRERVRDDSAGGVNGLRAGSRGTRRRDRRNRMPTISLESVTKLEAVSTNGVGRIPVRYIWWSRLTSYGFLTRSA
jgi:hypothetical protein